MKKSIKLILMIMCISIFTLGIVGCGGDSEEKTRLSIMTNLSRLSTSVKVSNDDKDFSNLTAFTPYNDIISLGNEGLNAMLYQFKNEEGIGENKEFLMAIACNDILDVDISNRTWKTGREWYDSYMASK